jgi:hypothetical protein
MISGCFGHRDSDFAGMPRREFKLVMPARIRHGPDRCHEYHIGHEPIGRRIAVRAINLSLPPFDRPCTPKLLTVFRDLTEGIVAGGLIKRQGPCKSSNLRRAAPCRVSFNQQCDRCLRPVSLIIS